MLCTKWARGVCIMLYASPAVLVLILDVNNGEQVHCKHLSCTDGSNCRFLEAELGTTVVCPCLLHSN